MLLRAYLLGGLILHKLVWTALKHRPANAKTANVPAPLHVRVIRAVKIGMLLGLAAQTLLPAVLPIHAPGGVPIAGLLLYTAGLALAIAGRVQLGNNWSDIEAATVRRDHAVVSNGVYRFIRHPIYSGDLALLFGMELALDSWLAVLVLPLVLVVVRKAVLEERSLTAAIGGYKAYCQRTGRFLPTFRG